MNVDDDVIDVTEALAPTGWAMKDIDPVRELAKFEAAAELQRKLIPASIKCTKPQDWVEMGGKVYLQGTGVERIAGLWGLVFDAPKIEKMDLGGGDFAYVVSGMAGSRRTGVFYKSIEGGRASDDPFFDRFDEDKPQDFKSLPADQRREWHRAHRIRPDELDVRKAAVTNWQTRAASMLTGMRGLTKADLEQAGLTGVKSVQFASGAKGGAAAPEEIAQARTELWNDIMKRTGGDIEAARNLLKEITSFKGDDGKVFPGYANHEGIKSGGMIGSARKKLAVHPTFGDAPEPGSRG